MDAIVPAGNNFVLSLGKIVKATKWPNPAVNRTRRFMPSSPRASCRRAVTFLEGMYIQIEAGREH
jgi:hypothetical protein